MGAMGAHHSVGSETLLIMPSRSMRSNSALTFGISGIGTRRAVETLYLGSR